MLVFYKNQFASANHSRNGRFDPKQINYFIVATVLIIKLNSNIAQTEQNTSGKLELILKCAATTRVLKNFTMSWLANKFHIKKKKTDADVLSNHDTIT